MWARIRKVRRPRRSAEQRGRPRHAGLLAVMPCRMCRGFLVDARHPNWARAPRASARFAELSGYLACTAIVAHRMPLGAVE